VHASIQWQFDSRKCHGDFLGAFVGAFSSPAYDFLDIYQLSTIWNTKYHEWRSGGWVGWGWELHHERSCHLWDVDVAMVEGTQLVRSLKDWVWSMEGIEDGTRPYCTEHQLKMPTTYLPVR